ncbi:hypothetical protein SAMN02745866_04311 [Alteromonadaceae bacterium Bs31]|nr:hypothetical protein SAMN02745866_04311 [Alteromonadaceae bacterium Bs31]
MRNLLISIVILGLPYAAFAAVQEEKNVWTELLVASFPILLFVVVFYIFLRAFGNKTKNINEKILESNIEIANQLKRIADHVEKNS